MEVETRMNNGLALVFEEWQRRYRENPSEFWDDADIASVTPPTYGEACARYFRRIVDDLARRPLAEHQLNMLREALKGNH